MTGNIRKTLQTREFFRKLRADVDGLLNRQRGVPVLDADPDSSTGINVWIDWTTGYLKYRSTNGNVVTVSGTGTPGAGSGALGGSNYSTELVELDPIAVGSSTVRTDGLLPWGNGDYSAIQFDMPALTPTNAEIIQVQVLLHPITQSTETAGIYIGGDLVTTMPGTYTDTPAPVSYGMFDVQQPQWVTIARQFGENLRDGVWDSLVLTPIPSSPMSWGTVVGLNQPGQAPKLRVWYQEVS